MAEVPPALKTLYPFLTVSKQFEKRDPVISYYCLMYFVQMGIKASKGDSSSKGYLLKIMAELEEKKKGLRDEEALKDDSIAQTLIEETALKMFDLADRKDRSSQYDKNLIKVFYTCGRLFTILEQFGEVSQDINDKMKYAKWKAVDISRCLANGITPTPGPPGGWNQDDDNDQETDEQGQPPTYGFNTPTGPSDMPPYPGGQQVLPPPPSSDDYRPVPAPRRHPGSSPGPERRVDPPPPTGPSQSFYPTPPPSSNQPPPPSASYNPAPISVPPPTTSYDPPPPTQSSGGVAKLSATDISKVQKYCKFAASSLDYEDTTAAIDYMEKALRLMKTGRE